MFKKKYMIILLFLIIAVGAVSQVNASDVNAGDEIAADDIVEDNIISENNIDDEINVDDSENEEIASDDSLMDEKIAIEYSENVISGEVSTKSPTVSADDANSNAVSIDNYSPYSTSKASSSSKKPVTIKATKMSAIYKSTKLYKIKVVDKNKKAVKGMYLKIKIFTGSKYKTLYRITNAKGIAGFSVNKLTAGNHNVVVSVMNKSYSAKSFKSLIKIKPRPVKFQTLQMKQGSLGIIVVQTLDKYTKMQINNLKVKLYIFSGKKYKKITLTTGYEKSVKYNGIVMYFTNVLSQGKHKVKIVVDGNYKGTAMRSLTIPKFDGDYYKAYGYSSKGKSHSFVRVGGKWIET